MLAVALTSVVLLLPPAPRAPRDGPTFVPTAAVGIAATHGYLTSIASFDLQGNKTTEADLHGSGQVFTCLLNSPCTPQHGYNGTLRFVAGVGGELIFRSKNGTEYRYGPADSNFQPARQQLKSIGCGSSAAALNAADSGRLQK